MMLKWYHVIYTAIILFAKCLLLIFFYVTTTSYNRILMRLRYVVILCLSSVDTINFFPPQILPPHMMTAFSPHRRFLLCAEDTFCDWCLLITTVTALFVRRSHAGSLWSEQAASQPGCFVKHGVTSKLQLSQTLNILMFSFFFLLFMGDIMFLFIRCLHLFKACWEVCLK